MDPYQPPAADIETSDKVGDGVRFFPVSIQKLAILYLVTFGLYAFVWFFENWKCVRDRLGERVWPVPRTLFYIFFTGSLFMRIKEQSDSRGLQTDWSPGGSTALFVLFTILGNLLDGIDAQSDSISILNLLSIAALVVTVFPLIKVQETVNQLNGDAEGRLNSRFTPWNILFLLLFGLIWLTWLVLIVGFIFNLELLSQ